MNHFDTPEFGPNSLERLVAELVVMRDAVVRLSLALDDFCFYAKSKQCPILALVVDAILARIKMLSLK